jgi:ABC-2 type transport system ATP-binding protein
LNTEGHTIILTTHYLEEAEALCERVAMMKDGKIVALDTTANLLANLAGKNLRLKLNQSNQNHVTLPTTLLPLLKSGESGVFTLALTELNQVEFVLGELRKAKVTIEDMQLFEADLEDVFMSLVGGKSGCQ